MKEVDSKVVGSGESKGQHQNFFQVPLGEDMVTVTLFALFGYGYFLLMHALLPRVLCWMGRVHFDDGRGHGKGNRVHSGQITENVPCSRWTQRQWGLIQRNYSLLAKWVTRSSLRHNPELLIFPHHPMSYCSLVGSSDLKLLLTAFYVLNLCRIQNHLCAFQSLSTS